MPSIAYTTEADRIRRATNTIAWILCGLHIAFVLGYYVGSGDADGPFYGVATATIILLQAVIVARGVLQLRRLRRDLGRR